MANEEEIFLSEIDAGLIKHIIFHGSITKTAASNLVTNLIGIDNELKKKSIDTGFGFSANQEDKDNTQSIKPKIILHLSSNGGLVQSAFMVADTISSIDTEVDCILDGSIASASVIILLACKKRAMQKHANIYVHETIHSCDQIFYSEIKDYLQEQEKIYDKVLNYYISNTNLTSKEVKNLLRDTSVLDRAKAKEYGFINADIKDIVT